MSTEFIDTNKAIATFWGFRGQDITCPKSIVNSQ